MMTIDICTYLVAREGVGAALEQQERHSHPFRLARPHQRRLTTHVADVHLRTRAQQHVDDGGVSAVTRVMQSRVLSGGVELVGGHAHRQHALHVENVVAEHSARQSLLGAETRNLENTCVQFKQKAKKRGIEPKSEKLAFF